MPQLRKPTRTPKSGRLGSINRFAAAVLACVWAVAGLAGFAAASVTGHRVLVPARLFSLWYELLWTRVAVEGRLLKWNQIVTPWRAG